MNNDEVRKRKLADIDANQRTRSDDPAWYFLAEISRCEILADHGREELTDGLWVQTVCELGLPLECVENIKRALIGFAIDAWVHFKQGKLEAPGRIRLFCQKKILDDANSTQITPPRYSGSAVENIKIIHPSITKMDGGWGYFIIERGGKGLPGTSDLSWNLIDLYLYKEGE